MQLNMKEAYFPNFNKFMTPLYASPNILQKTPTVNYYLEDVFSLGVSFIQMAGPYSSEELATFALNGQDTTHHSENHSEYKTVTPMLEMALNKCQGQLPYFHK